MEKGHDLIKIARGPAELPDRPDVLHGPIATSPPEEAVGELAGGRDSPDLQCSKPLN